jgi:hypothetical protein
MVIFGDPNDRFDHIWEAAATAAALMQRMIDFGRHDQVPGILVEQLDDRVLDLLFRDQIAVADKHRKLWEWLAARFVPAPSGYDLGAGTPH